MRREGRVVDASHLDDDARGDMCQSDGTVRLIDMLSTCTCQRDIPIHSPSTTHLDLYTHQSIQISTSTTL